MFEGAVATNTLMRNGRNDGGIQVTELSNAEKRDVSELVPRNIPLISSTKSIERQDSKDVVTESKQRDEEVGLDTVEQVVHVPDGKNQDEETEILRPEHTQGDIDCSEEALPGKDDNLSASIPDRETESTDPAQSSNKVIDDTKMDSQEPSAVAPSLQIGSGQLSQSANTIPKLPVQQPCLAPLTTVPTSTVQLPSAENELVRVSVLTNMETAIESMDSGVITALPPIAVSEIMQDLPVTTPIPEQLDDEDTVSAGASQNISEVPSVPLTNLVIAINKSPHISQVVETVTTPKEIVPSSTSSDEQSTSIVAMDVDILPPHDTTMDIDPPNTYHTVDHANYGPSDCGKVIANDKIVLEVVSDEVSSDVVDPKGFKTSETFEKDDHYSTPKSSRKSVSLDGSAVDAADSMEDATGEIVGQLPSAFVASRLTPHSETDGQQHTPTLETPVELVVDSNLKMLAENASKISTESPPHDELPELVDESSQLNKDEVEVSQAAGSLLQEQDIIRPEEKVSQCLEKKQDDAIDSGLDVSVEIDAMKGVRIVDDDPIQRIVTEEVDSMQQIIPDDGDLMQEVATESVKMAMKDSELTEDISAGESEYADPTNQSPDEKTAPALEAMGLKSLNEDIVKVSSSIENDVNQNSSSNDNTSIPPATPSHRSVSLPSWSAPIPPVAPPPNSKSLPIAPLSRQQSPIPSRAPIPRAPSPIPEHLSILVRRYLSPARDSSPVRLPSSTRDLTPIRDVSPIKDTSPTRVPPAPRRSSSRLIPCREIPAVVITVPPQTQTITPLPAEYPTTEDATSTFLTLPRIKIKFNESSQSSVSPPPAKRQKVSHPKTKGIFDCIVVRSDFENVLPTVIGNNM